MNREITAKILAVIVIIFFGIIIFNSPENANGDEYTGTEITIRLGEILESSNFERMYTYSGIAPASVKGVITLLYMRDIVYGGMGANACIYFYQGDTVYLFNEPYKIVKISSEMVTLRRIS